MKAISLALVLWYQIVHSLNNANKTVGSFNSFLLLSCLVIQGKDVVCLIYNITTCNFNLGVIRIYMFEILKKNLLNQRQWLSDDQIKDTNVVYKLGTYIGQKWV